MRRIGLFFALAVLVAANSARAATIDVLWYTGGGQDYSGPGDYQAQMTTLAGYAPSSPGANTWNLTFWDTGAPPAGSFDVLVTMSEEGGWGSYPDYTALNTAVTGSQITYGNRIMVTGQDADWHFINSPGDTGFDGPRGFLLDAINWAGSGTGMGAVFLGTQSAFTSPGLTGFLYTGGSGDDIVIPAAYAAAPINTGLTSAGLSNWSTSSHQTYQITDATQWVAINRLGSEDGDPITIVSAEEVGGGVTPEQPPTVPEPLTLSMLGLGMVGMYRARRRNA